MRLKADWTTHLHALRAREFELVFDRFPRPAFDTGLELGAGDGFQSRLLVPYVKELTVTDYYLPRLSVEGVVVMACDAERVGETFPPESFDLVYSSNLLEHVPNARAALRGIAAVMKPDGITIHVMPNPTWKLLNLALYVPDRVALKLDPPAEPDGEASHGNNPKVAPRSRPRLLRKLIPEPHGASPTNRAEFGAFSSRRWAHDFSAAGLELVAVLTGPFSSGYGFGADRLRAVLERAGIGSHSVYVARRSGRKSRFAADYF